MDELLFQIHLNAVHCGGNVFLKATMPNHNWRMIFTMIFTICNMHNWTTLFKMIFTMESTIARSFIWDPFDAKSEPRSSPGWEEWFWQWWLIYCADRDDRFEEIKWSRKYLKQFTDMVQFWKQTELVKMWGKLANSVSSQLQGFSVGLQTPDSTQDSSKIILISYISNPAC